MMSGGNPATEVMDDVGRTCQRMDSRRLGRDPDRTAVHRPRQRVERERGEIGVGVAQRGRANDTKLDVG